jgi:hypothetical protein
MSTDRRDAVIAGASRAGLMLNSATDFRKTAYLQRPNLTAVNGLGEVDVDVKKVVYSQEFGLKQLQKSEELEYILFGSG